MNDKKHNYRTRREEEYRAVAKLKNDERQKLLFAIEDLKNNALKITDISIQHSLIADIDRLYGTVIYNGVNKSVFDKFEWIKNRIIARGVKYTVMEK